MLIKTELQKIWVTLDENCPENTVREKEFLDAVQKFFEEPLSKCTVLIEKIS